MKKKWFNIIILLSTIVIFFGVVLFTDGVDKFIDNIAKVSPFWLTIAILCMMLYWLLEAAILHIFVKSKYKRYNFLASLRVSMIGQFFNAVTPFASGGQPMQLYAMSKDGISSGEAGSILVMKFIVYQMVLTIYSLLIIIFKYSFFVEHVDKFMILTIVGFIVNSFVIFLLYIFSHYAKNTKKFIHTVFKLCVFLKILKENNNIEKKIEDELLYFKENSSKLKTNNKLLISTTILTVIQLTSFFLIAYFIYRGFGFEGNLVNIIAANAFVTMIASFIPLPGASGGAEVSFGMLFNIFLPGQILPAIFLWRFTTYYLNLIVGGLVTVIAPERRAAKQPLRASKIVYKKSQEF